MAQAIARALPSGLSQEAAGVFLGDLYAEHGRRVYGLCRLLLRDPVDAEDAAQQTFLSAHRSLLNGTLPRDPAVWLTTIARNECRARIRARRTDPVAVDPVPDGRAQDFDQVTTQRAEIAELCEALAGLSDLQRQTIVLREFYGLSYDEVGTVSGIGTPAVKSVLFRARRRLQEKLRHLRFAPGAFVFPLALRDSIAQAIPGLASQPSAPGSLAKLASLPAAAKLAGATVTAALVGTVGGATVTAPPDRLLRPAGAASTPTARADRAARPPSESELIRVPRASASEPPARTARQGAAVASESESEPEEAEAAEAEFEPAEAEAKHSAGEEREGGSSGGEREGDGESSEGE